MRIGTKSLLFGCHQFIIHPVCVWVAWVKLYKGLPGLSATLTIIAHDWGYFGKEDMDGKSGNSHPEFAVKLFNAIGMRSAARLCMMHSRFYGLTYGVKEQVPEDMMLRWADKLGNCLVPAWLYPRLGAWTREIDEYVHCEKHEGTGNAQTYKEFYLRYRGVVREILLQSCSGKDDLVSRSVYQYALSSWSMAHIPYSGHIVTKKEETA